MQTTLDIHTALFGISLGYSIYTTKQYNSTFYVKSFKVNYYYICNTVLMCDYGAYHLDNKPIIIIIIIKPHNQTLNYSFKVHPQITTKQVNNYFKLQFKNSTSNINFKN